MTQPKRNSGKPAAASKKSGRKLDIDSLLQKIVHLLVLHNPRSLTFSKVSRLTGVPRSTLYYYFGNDRTRMIEEAVRFGVQSFAQIQTLSRDKRFSSWDKYQLARIRISTRLAISHPWGPALYVRYRNDPGTLGEIVRKIEADFIEGTIRQWRRFHGTEPDPMAIAISSALKLGYVWGVSNLGGTLPDKQSRKLFEQMAEMMARVSTQVMGEKF